MNVVRRISDQEPDYNLTDANMPVGVAQVRPQSACFCDSALLHWILAVARCAKLCC